MCIIINISVNTTYNSKWYKFPCSKVLTNIKGGLYKGTNDIHKAIFLIQRFRCSSKVQQADVEYESITRVKIRRSQESAQSKSGWAPGDFSSQTMESERTGNVGNATRGTCRASALQVSKRCRGVQYKR